MSGEYLCGSCGRQFAFDRRGGGESVSCPGCAGLALPLIDLDELPGISPGPRAAVEGESSAAARLLSDIAAGTGLSFLDEPGGPEDPRGPLPFRPPRAPGAGEGERPALGSTPPPIAWWFNCLAYGHCVRLDTSLPERCPACGSTRVESADRAPGPRWWAHCGSCGAIGERYGAGAPGSRQRCPRCGSADVSEVSGPLGVESADRAAEAASYWLQCDGCFRWLRAAPGAKRCPKCGGSVTVYGPFAADFVPTLRAEGGTIFAPPPSALKRCGECNTLTWNRRRCPSCGSGKLAPSGGRNDASGEGGTMLPPRAEPPDYSALKRCAGCGAPTTKAQCPYCFSTRLEPYSAPLETAPKPPYEAALSESRKRPGEFVRYDPKTRPKTRHETTRWARSRAKAAALAFYFGWLHFRGAARGVALQGFERARRLLKPRGSV